MHSNPAASNHLSLASVFGWFLSAARLSSELKISFNSQGTQQVHQRIEERVQRV